jgi:hypothetical protein
VAFLITCVFPARRKDLACSVELRLMATIGQFFWSRRLHSSRRNSSEPTQMHKRIFDRCRRGNVHQLPAFSAELVQPTCSSHGICRDVHDQVFPAAHDCTRSIRAPCGSLTARFRRTYSAGVSAYRVHPNTREIFAAMGCQPLCLEAEGARASTFNMVALTESTQSLSLHLSSIFRSVNKFIHRNAFAIEWTSQLLTSAS